MLLDAANASTAAAGGADGPLQQWKLGPWQHHHSASGNNATEPFLLIGVLSVPKSRERRDAVRHTWMRDAGPDVAVRFVLYEVRSDWCGSRVGGVSSFAVPDASMFGAGDVAGKSR